MSPQFLARLQRGARPRCGQLSPRAQCGLCQRLTASSSHAREVSGRPCYEFECGAREGEGVTVPQVVTAFVMVSQQMDAELALKYVQMKHPPAWPNQGFRYQLKLFEDMGCTLVSRFLPPAPSRLPGPYANSGRKSVCQTLSWRPAHMVVPSATSQYLFGGAQDPDYEPFRRYLLGTLTQQGVHGQESLPAPAEPTPTDEAQVPPAACRCQTAGAALDCSSLTSWRTPFRSTLHNVLQVAGALLSSPEHRLSFLCSPVRQC